MIRRFLDLSGLFIGLTLNRYRRLAEIHHAEFRSKSGSEQIASAFAIGVVMAALDRLAPTRILEVGSGIGTMTKILVCRGADVYYAEDSPWCVESMRRHLTPAERYRLFPSLGYLHGLIVVDGDQVKPAAALGLLQHGGWILVEGNRRTWRAGLTGGSRPFVSVNLRPFDRSKGVWLLAFEPTPRLQMAFTLERAWQRVLGLVSWAWSSLTGTPIYHGKRRLAPSLLPGGQNP